MIDTIRAYQLDWGPITVEAYDEKKNQATIIFNCDLTTEEKSKDVIQYVVGRTLWCCRNFPPGVRIVLTFDIRGQDLALSKSKMFEIELQRLMNGLNSNNYIVVDFLR